MRGIQGIQRRMDLRLFLSHLIVVLVGVVVLAGTAELHTPAAMERHLANMQALLGSDAVLANDFHNSFHIAVNEILAVAAAAALLAALVTSIFVARRIVVPIQQMMHASRRIAAGDYHERVQVPDVDELGALAEDFNRMAKSLEQTEQLRLELIGNVSHELRTPLTSIRSIMEGLLDGVLPAEPATYVRIQREAIRLQRLVDDLQELSRAEARQIPLQLQPISLADLIRAAADRLHVQFEDKDVALNLDISPHLPDIQGDADRIVQVLLNLLGNALHYTLGGGRVTVQAWTAGMEAMVSVQDTGIGISPAHLPHVFERFYRVDRSRSRAGGGSGIGLTISRHLIEAHGGRIWVESAGEGQGSTFTFAIPRAA